MEDSTGAVPSVTLDNREFTQAYRYMSFNSKNIYQFREMHKSMVEDELRRGHHRISLAIIHKHHMEKFCGWFRDVFDAGIGPHCDEDDTYEFYENIPYNVPSNDAGRENLRWGRDDVEGMTIDASIIGERDLHEMDNLDDCEFIDDESTDEDDNKVEYNDDE
nr:hypothetical protein CFP56_62641 [Quercus suber]